MLYLSKAKRMIAEGRYWDLTRKVFSFVPAFNRMGNRFTDWYLRRKYGSLVYALKDKYKLQGGGGA